MLLRIIAEQLVSLSSMAVVNIRDAVTEAALVIGCKAVSCQVPTPPHTPHTHTTHHTPPPEREKSVVC